MRKTIRPALCAITVAVTLAGCSGFEANNDSVRVHDDVKVNDAARAEDRLAAQRHASTARDIVEHASRPYTGSQQIAPQKSAQWPAALRRDAQVNLRFADNVIDVNGNAIIPLADFAQKINLATGIPVRVKPDALQDESGKAVSVMVPVTTKGSLVPLFEQLAARYRVHVDFENGQLEFFRTTTRRFIIGSAAATVGGDMSVDSGGGEGGFNTTATMKSKFQEIDVPKSLIPGIKQWMSKGAPEPTYNPATGSLTVTDTPEALDKIGEYIDSEKRLANRGVIFDIDVIKYSSKNTGSSGVNWQVAYLRAKELSTASFNYASPTKALDVASGMLGATLSPGKDGQNRFAGSTALIAALNETGHATVIRHEVLETQNRAGVVYAANKTFDYVNEVSAASSLSGVASGQKTKTENAGRVLMLVPAITDDNEATVDISVRESVKNPFGTNTSGKGDSQTTVMLLDKDTEVTRQRVGLRNGESRVLTAIADHTTDGTDQSFDQHLSAVFGGNVSGDRTDDHYYLVVTMRFKD